FRLDTIFPFLFGIEMAVISCRKVMPIGDLLQPHILLVRALGGAYGHARESMGTVGKARTRFV
ncbi:MAG: hypothetical protein KDK08_21585, partial [Rhizobiaceae bacterium]|nr:hypothetical protein [Rhizobiaceae bacterium]